MSGRVPGRTSESLSENISMSYPTLLNSVLRKSRCSAYPDLTDDDFFEIFCADIVLVDFDLNNEEIESGIIDGSQDGGIDAAYLFINRRIWSDDFEYSNLRNPIDIELILIQSKNQHSFKETSVDKLSSSLPLLLSSDLLSRENESIFRPEVNSLFCSFHKCMTDLAYEFPQVSVRITAVRFTADGDRVTFSISTI